MRDVWMALLPKQDAPTEPMAVRPISVLAILYRLWASTRALDMQTWASDTYHRWQLAYVKGRSSRNALGHLSVMIDESLQNHTEIHVLALDATKAFPSVNRKQVARLLQESGYPAALIDLTEHLYREGKASMRYGGQAVSETPFHVTRGIHQGCPLSVLAFNILLTGLCEKLEHKGRTSLRHILCG